MEAIDFKQLLREEKRKQRKKVRQCKNDTGNTDPVVSGYGGDGRCKNEVGEEGSIVTHNNQTQPRTSTPGALPEWPYQVGFLAMKALNLNVICQNPESIYYSVSAFSNQKNSVLDGDNDGPSSSTSMYTTPTSALEEWLNSIGCGESGLGEWKTMKYGKRRVCMFGEGDDDNALTPPLDEIAQQLVDRGVFPPEERPNHVLLNEYQPGQGILPHTDGPLYISRTATLSLSSTVIVEFTKRLSSDQIGNMSKTTIPDINEPISIVLQPGSLLVFEDDAYLNYCHSIEMDVLADITKGNCLNAEPGKVIERGKRFSLTFRHKKKHQQK